jgi:hypothetical protein
MKVKNIIWLFIVMALSWVACEESTRDSLDLSGDVQITSFAANGAQATITEQTNQIKLMLPVGTDLSALSPVIELSEGAVVSPASGETRDFTAPVTYLVTNGNLYAKYKVTAEIITAKITRFTIGNYIGTIDETAKTIKLVMPLETDVTNLTPTVEYTSGATMTPAAGSSVDFTNPVTYTLNYLGEDFTYEVSIEKKDNRYVAFVGTAKKAIEMTENDQIAAYDWLMQNVQNSSYICFDDIKSGAVDLTNYSVVWWHLDTDSKELPAIAKDQTVVNAFKAYYAQGGSLFLTSWASRYVATLGIPGDGREPNNMWGDGNTPFVTGDDWGICFKGNESHPIFNGLETVAGNSSKAFLLGAGCKAKAHNALWNFDWGDYANNIPGWTSATGAVNLASFHWDDNATARSVIFEYPKVVNGKGGVICIGIESYDWYNEDNSIDNVYKSNIEKLSFNIINYLID